MEPKFVGGRRVQETIQISCQVIATYLYGSEWSIWSFLDGKVDAHIVSQEAKNNFLVHIRQRKNAKRLNAVLLRH